MTAILLIIGGCVSALLILFTLCACRLAGQADAWMEMEEETLQFPVLQDRYITFDTDRRSTARRREEPVPVHL